MFRTGLNILERVEEVKACLNAHHLSWSNQALFIYDNLEGEARQEITYYLHIMISKKGEFQMFDGQQCN